MYRVDDVYDEAIKIIEVCDDVLLFRWLGDAVSMIANKADFEGWKGWLDICTTCEGGNCITLPREVGTVLAVNIGGRPALGFGQLFNFHLNGPGDCRRSCDFSWQDQGAWHATYRDIVTPSKVVAYTQSAEDNGKELIVFGYDHRGNKLRRFENGVYRDGYRVPTIFGLAVPDADAPIIARITDVFKQKTNGSMRLATVDSNGITGINLGVYEPDETNPQFRRIKINRNTNWVRIAYMKKNPTFNSRYDHVPLNSRLALLLALEARKFYQARKIAEAHAYEADAARLELEAQNKIEPNTTLNPIVVHDGMGSLVDKSDYGVE